MEQNLIAAMMLHAMPQTYPNIATNQMPNKHTGLQLLETKNN